MLPRLPKMGLVVSLLAPAAAPSWAASLPPLHAPAMIRLDFTRPGGMPGAPRDIAAARDSQGGELVGQADGQATGQPTARHKRRLHPH